MHFARPDMLLWLLSLPLLVAVVAGYWAWKRALVRRLGHVPTIRAMTERHAPRMQVARQALVLLAITLLIVAAARPQWGQTNRLVKRTGIDVVFALDLSESMLARDVIPSRLDAAKREIVATLERLKGDRAGLVVFTSVSFPQSPLTSDYGAIRFYLRKLQPGQISFGGTSLGRAIDDSLELLTGERLVGDEDAPAAASGQARPARDHKQKIKRARTQLIVLITDGEDHESDLKAAARLARERNIHIVTVGFGSAAGERIPLTRQDGTVIGYKRDRKGRVVYTKLDEAALQRIAADTGGLALRYDGEGSVANQLIAYINQLERSEMETMMRRRYKDHFMVFLIPALLCLLAALALGDRKRLKPTPKRGQSTALTKVGLLLTLLLLTPGCEEMFTREIEPVARGNKLVAAGDHDAALKAYEEALVELPADARLTYNMGTAQLGLDDHERAQETLANALASDDPTLRLRARYNLGVSLMRQEKWAEAHATFKQALADAARYPDRDDIQDHPARRDAAHNMELAFRKLYPPCAQLEDEHEDNDSRATPTRLTQLQLKDLSLCGLDDDWFAVPVLPGTRLEVRATFRNLRAKPDPEHVFLPAPEDLTVTLFNSTGERVLAESRGEPEAAKPDDKKAGDKKAADKKADDKTKADDKKADDDQRADDPRATRLIASMLITPDMLGAAPANKAGGKGEQSASVVLLRMRAAEHLEFKYDVSITAIPPCSAIDDKHEPNNARAQARALEPGEHKLQLCKGDEDWFIVNAQLGDTFFVDVQPMQDPSQEQPAKAALEIRDARTGKLITRGKDESGVVTAGVWDIMSPGAYAVRVVGADAEQQGPYTLQLHSFAPCPVGDDRFEDNDVADRAALLDPQAPMHRYLRICPQDRDFYRLALKPPQPPNAPKDANTDKKADQKDAPNKLAYGLSIVRRPGEPDPTDSEAPRDDDALPLGFDLMSPSGDQIVSQSVEVGKKPDDGAAPRLHKAGKKRGKRDEGDATPSVRIDRILQHDDLPQQEALLRVQGPSLFYHLVQLNPQSQQSQDQQQKDKNPEQQEDKSENKQQGDRGEDDKNKQDEPDKKPDDKQGDRKDKGEPDKKPGDKNRKDGEDKERGKDASQDRSQDGKAEQPAREDPKAQRVEDVLRALEQTDDNFQMRKALQHIPRQRYYIEKDW